MSSDDDYVKEDDYETYDDQQYTRDKNYISDQVPTDVYRYKLLRIKPNAESDYRGIVDKDLVLSNLKGELPTMEELQELVELLVLMQQVFVVEKEVVVVDEYGRPRLTKDTDGRIHPRTVTRRVFDDLFEPSVSYVRAMYKYRINAARGHGKDREAIIDKTEFLGKSVIRRKEDQQGRAFGLGGGNKQ